MNKYKFDPLNGKLDSHTEPNGYTQSYEWDSLGRLTSFTPAGFSNPSIDIQYQFGNISKPSVIRTQQGRYAPTVQLLDEALKPFTEIHRNELGGVVRRYQKLFGMNDRQLAEAPTLSNISSWTEINDIRDFQVTTYDALDRVTSIRRPLNLGFSGQYSDLLRTGSGTVGKGTSIIHYGADFQKTYGFEGEPKVKITDHFGRVCADVEFNLTSDAAQRSVLEIWNGVVRIPMVISMAFRLIGLDTQLAIKSYL